MTYTPIKIYRDIEDIEWSGGKTPAIPEKQDDDDIDLNWRKVIQKVRAWHRNSETEPFDNLFNYLKSHYELTKK